MKTSFYVNQNKVYSEKVQLIDYGLYQDFILLKSYRAKGFEEIEKNKKNKKNEKTDKEEINRIEISRIKQKIKELCLCNPFEFFYTQTLNQNRYDLDNFVKTVQKLFKAYKRKNKDFIYLIIYEKHLDGAFHLHGLVGGLGLDLYENKYGYLSLHDFEILGFNSLKKLGSLKEDKMKVASYVSKYISEDFLKTSSGYSYFHSQGLSLAKRTMLDDFDFSTLELKFENDFVKIFRKK